MGISPIGLFAAAVLAVLLAIGEVCNKKTVEGQEVVAAVFWIRIFAVLEFSLVLIVFAWRGSLPLLHVPATIAPAELRDIPTLVDQLVHPANAATQRVAHSLSEATQKELAAYESNAQDPELATTLSQDLNSDNIAGGDLLYNSKDFAGVSLSTETRQALSKKPRGAARAYTNRLLLEDLFPGTIARTRKCALFGVQRLLVSPRTAFLSYLLIEVILVAASQSLFSYALKVSALSLSVPFTTFAPIFLLATGYIVLGELPTSTGLMGIALIVIGGMIMHRRLFALQWRAPLQAIFRERGSRYILLSTLIGSVYGPIEKQLILMSDPITTAFAYGVGTVVALWVLCKVRRVKLIPVMRHRPGWAMLSGLSDANTMFAQFIAVMYLPVVIVICIKRGGIVLTVLAGWLIFRERDITDRLIAAFVMMGGIGIFYLPLRWPQALILSCLVLLCLAVALYLTRSANRQSTLEGESVPRSDAS